MRPNGSDSGDDVQNGAGSFVVAGVVSCMIFAASRIRVYFYSIFLLARVIWLCACACGNQPHIF